MNVNNILYDLENKNKCIFVMGLGYVGFPLAVELSKVGYKVVGYDVDEKKIVELTSKTYIFPGYKSSDIYNENITFTNEPSMISTAAVVIVAVPTPINNNNEPDLTGLIQASKTIGQHLNKNSLVIYESTVYPGVTEDICNETIKKYTNLVYPNDYEIAYSPERISPGDSSHGLKQVKKIISSNGNALSVVKAIYEKIVTEGVISVKNIKTAEAIKLIENTQRDINIAFLNEVALILHELNIDTNDVLQGMKTKWNSLDFSPGLVGGHCIAVDPNYLIWLAEKIKKPIALTKVARSINDGLSDYIVNEVKNAFENFNIPIKTSRIVVFGVTFKENCADIRNSQSIKIIKMLEQLGFEVLAVDPYINEETSDKLNIKTINKNNVSDADAIIFTVPHSEFYKISYSVIESFYKKSLKKRILFDVKNIFNEIIFDNKYYVWRL